MSPFRIPTEVVWKATTQVGCYQAACDRLVNPDGSETFPGYSPSYFVSRHCCLFGLGLPR